MGTKAKRNHTSEQPPPGDDVHWMPLVEAVAMLTKRMTSKRFAIPVIEKAMESGKLPYMRYLTTGERETPPPAFTGGALHPLFRRGARHSLSR